MRAKTARIGLYSIGLKAYWKQFEGLEQRMKDYNRFIGEKLSEYGQVVNLGLVDDEDRGKEAGEAFNAENVDLVFCHCATYATSSVVLPVHQRCKAPLVILNLQPSKRVNYEKTTTGEWLAHCGACVAPELCNALERAGISFRIVSGMLGLERTPAISMTDEETAVTSEAIRAWKQIGEWARAAGAVRTLRESRFGFLGNTYSGMLDLYSDFTQLQAQTGIHVEVLEMCDLHRFEAEITEPDVREKLAEIEDMFEISGDSPADPLAKAPSQEQLSRSALVAAMQERFVSANRLDALTYYYHGAPGNEYERLQSDFIVGHSLLTAKGIPCAGEGDLKTNVAMKVCDSLSVGGSFCEIITTDYADKTILLGHDGPFHVKIAEGKPILRGMGLYHGKKGAGVSVEAKVKTGAVTTLGLTQQRNGRIKFIIGEGIATDGKIMAIGNTQTPIRFALEPDEYMEKWFAEAPTHHFAMSVGHNASLFEKVAILLNCDYVIV